ncbi:LysR family transcriptional regulator ArgP [Halopseudomonas salina]|uniref:HTH-type transcriptional regulator ArgP n=1 Tax=Halopseudomonas salina TaxID=1323744 RepID=A0ABQ1PK24_9GAMM|nr:LysR family transcriptional regulator ArgP [Halopseudomonas salina]GGC98577.1 HTH-type transcriptional regulator ArgP [Halopseudomonas salina]
MFDYKLLEALAAVVEQGGFERAAQVLGLSQSAISQRIKLLESRVGAPVLLRLSPPLATPAGQRLLNHAQQVRLLERDLGQDLPMVGDEQGPTRLRIALNADSLATWWAPAVADFCVREQMLVDLVTDDQEVVLRRMRAGDVAGCVCATAEPVAGARSVPLGSMRYLAVASAAVLGREHQGLRDPAAVLRILPAVVFGPDDQLQHRFLSEIGHKGDFQHHLCPSSEGFVRMLCAGMGWGMVPALQIQPQLRSGELCEVLPGRHVDVPLFWHYWRHGGRLLEALTRCLIIQAPLLLADGHIA